MSVENEDELNTLLSKARLQGFSCSPFYEPDIGNQLTAIAIGPHINVKKLTGNLPLLLKELKQQKQTI